MKFFLSCILLILSAISDGQINYSGHYGYSESHKDFIKRHPEAKKDESGYQKDLVLLRLNNNQCRFWLFVTRGYQSYNSGHTEGVINVILDSAVYSEKDTEALVECKLIFHFYKNEIFIDHVSGDCGFGANVTAHGKYPVISSKIPTARDIANTYQYEISESKIVSEQATIYKTANDSEPSQQYFIKGDKIYRFDEENNFVYFQFITKNGKYIEGWLKKPDLD